MAYLWSDAELSNERSTWHRTYSAEQSRENMHLAEIEALRTEVLRLQREIDRTRNRDMSSSNGEINENHPDY